jgi:hypothetical protein
VGSGPKTRYSDNWRSFAFFINYQNIVVRRLIDIMPIAGLFEMVLFSRCGDKFRLWKIITEFQDTPHLFGTVYIN